MRRTLEREAAARVCRADTVSEVAYTWWWCREGRRKLKRLEALASEKGLGGGSVPKEAMGGIRVWSGKKELRVEGAIKTRVRKVPGQKVSNGAERTLGTKGALNQSEARVREEGGVDAYSGATGPSGGIASVGLDSRSRSIEGARAA